jgi:hypothetical protein
LSDQQDLKQFLFRSLQIGQKPDFFENVRRHLVGLVHHNDGRQLLLIASNQILAEVVKKFSFLLAPGGEPQVGANIPQELQRRQAAVEDIRIRTVDVTPLQQSQEITDQDYA